MTTHTTTAGYDTLVTLEQQLGQLQCDMSGFDLPDEFHAFGKLIAEVQRAADQKEAPAFSGR